MTPATLEQLPAPHSVHKLIRQHMIGDGFPIVFDLERSHGAWIVDGETGDEFLDFYSFFASLPLGFHHEAFYAPKNRERLFAAALHKTANSDAHSAELAAFLDCFAREAMPTPMRHLFFIEGGALAVENALKTAFDWKVRRNLAAGRGELGRQIAHFRQAFHGRSGYTLSLTNTDPVKTQHFPKFDWPRIHNPHLKFPIDAAEVERVSADEDRAVAELREAFSTHRHDIAAIIIEPIQGEGGDHHFRAEFFAKLRQIADEEEALLIFDEVQSGFGITGQFWAYQHFGVTPDILCFGKKSQVCGIMAGPRVDEVPDNVFAVSSRINSTWGGGLVDMVRCQIILDVMRRERSVENAATVGDELVAGLRDLEAEFAELVSNSRGRGLFCAFDLPDSETRAKFLAETTKQRLLILPCGVSAVRVRPPLTLTSEEAVIGLQRIRTALETVAATQ